MKKLLIVTTALAALALTAGAQRTTFVPEKDIMRIQKPGRDVWPEPVKVAETKLVGPKNSQTDWKVENNEIISGEKALVLPDLKKRFIMFFEFTADADSEGYVYFRAPGGDVSKAIKVRLADVNGPDKKNRIGSVAPLDPAGGTDLKEAKEGRWVRMTIVVDKDIFRVGDTERLSSNYADGNLAAYKFENWAKKSGNEVPEQGETGIVCTKGKIKLKKFEYVNFN